jgi:hypothetical protein
MARATLCGESPGQGIGEKTPMDLYHEYACFESGAFRPAIAEPAEHIITAELARRAKVMARKAKTKAKAIESGKDKKGKDKKGKGKGKGKVNDDKGEEGKGEAVEDFSVVPVLAVGIPRASAASDFLRSITERTAAAADL